MSEEKKWIASPGTVRPSQLITTFGPGSIIQVENDSVIVLGIDYWFNKENENEKFKELNHPYLEAKLGVDHFKTPRPLGKKNVIPCRSFPTWGVCRFCKRMQKHARIPQKNAFHCDFCSTKPVLTPARFITICENGHLDEFPWIEWAHSTSEEGVGEICERPSLKFWARGDGQSLSDYSVYCENCKKSRTCGDAVSEHGLENIVFSCNGSSPWLGTSKKCVDKKTKSSILVRGIQVRASSIHYPVITSAIFIPEWLHPIHETISENKPTILALKSAKDSWDHRRIAEQMPFFQSSIEEFGIDEVIKHLDKRLSLSEEKSKYATEKEVKDIEYSNLYDADEGFHEKKKLIEIENVEIDDEIKPFFNKLTKLKRITEIKVLRAFTRNTAPDPYSSDTSQKTEYCKIFRSKKPHWLPAIENKGEGIFFTLNEERLKKWESNSKVRERCDATIDGFEKWAEEREWEVEESFKPRYLLLHTISHAIIRELSNSSGYSEASIQERIYHGKNQCGILLYTSTSSSDGSLGGLVRKGNLDEFSIILDEIKKKSERCSRDPLCGEDDPIKKRENKVASHARINGSACYGCVLLPETSCENFNKLLDRMLLTHKEFGFFSEKFD
jgi:hypothetical protein